MKIIKLLLFFTVVFSSFPMATLEKPTKKTLAVWIEQDGKRIKKEEGIFYLSKDQFDLVFRGQKGSRYFVNFSYSDKSYKEYLSGVKAEDLTAFYHSGMAEGMDNDEFNYIPRVDASHYWFFEGYEEKRFNEVEEKNGSYYLTRTLKHEFRNQNNYLIESIDQQELYIIVAEYEGYDESYNKLLGAVEVFNIKFD